jgi:hypothetical protein
MSKSYFRMTRFKCTHKCLAGIGAPVSKQSVLEVLRPEWLPQQRVGTKIDHPCAKIVAGAPVCVDLAKFLTA